MIAGAFLRYGACAALVVGLVACGETDQKAKTEKVYAGKKDERAYDNKLFGNYNKKWETTMAARTRTQNEYLRTDTK